MTYADPPVFGAEEKDSLVYSRLLFQSGRGYALWKPRPSSNVDIVGEEEAIGVQIGDVGVLTKDGAFVALLNIDRSDHATAFNARRGVPPNIMRFDLVKLAPHPLIHGANFPGVVFTPAERPPPPQFERSNPPETRVQVHFRGSGEKSAALSIFPDTPTLVQRCPTSEIESLRVRASLSHSRWLEFVRRTPQYSTVKSLFLVTGFTKSKSWANALMKKSKNVTQCSVTFTKRDGQDESLRIHTSPTDPSDSFMRRRSKGTSTDPNHALFINGLLISSRSRLPFGLGGVDVLETFQNTDVFGKLFKNGAPFLEGNSTHNRQGGTGTAPTKGASTGGFTSGVPFASSIFNPLSAANEFILRSRPDIEVAITHDGDFKHLFTNPKLAHSIAECTEEEFIRLVAANYHVSVKDKCGWLEHSSMCSKPGHHLRHVQTLKPVITTTSAF